ncbi:MAG: hypothetical protein ACRBFS_16655 [Aureispira sp.]
MDQNDYIELLSGYLINHFRSHNSYEEGVKSAIKELTSDPKYLKEMRIVFLYFLESKTLEKDLVKNIVRNNANFFVSNDENALKKLHFIYEDTLLEEEIDIPEEEEIVFDPKTMDKDTLRTKIFDKALDSEIRINAALLLRKSQDERFTSTLLKIIQESQDELKYGFVLVLMGGSNWEGKFEWLSTLLISNSNSSIKKSIAYYIREHGQDIAEREEIVALLISALKQEDNANIKKNYISTLIKYQSLSLKEIIKSFDLQSENTHSIFALFLRKATTDQLSLKTLLKILPSAPFPIQEVIIKHLKNYNSLEVLNVLDHIVIQESTTDKVKKTSNKVCCNY